jgi:very-short-patch-repair endonuclease
VTSSGLSIEIRHAAQLSYVTQQSAVPWLYSMVLQNNGTRVIQDLCVRIDVRDFVDSCELRVDQLAVGERHEVTLPDLHLHADAFVNLIERARVDLVVSVASGQEEVAREVRPLDVLAYNEWPGLREMPSLLVAFVAPNHPALTPVLHAVAERLAATTSDSALNGYQSQDVSRVRKMIYAVHDAMCAVGIRYVSAPPSFERDGQKVRMPEQVLGERLGTCLDLSLLYAGVFEQIGLQPFVVIQNEHAFTGVWLHAKQQEEVEFGPALELRKAARAGELVLIETTMACVTPIQTADRAIAAAEQRLQDDQKFRVAIDVAAARRFGIRPLPFRTSLYSPVVGDLPPIAREQESDLEITPGDLPLPAQGGVEAASAAPRDRLEHWQQKLLDLSMFNRLLNFVETKKTIRLCEHDLADVEDRLQGSARMRLHCKPHIGESSDPRDLELAEQRSGQDVMGEYLAAELRAGRWRCDLDDDQLDTRLIEIFRHARSTLEESGANTLYLAIGFLRWFETSESKKPRRAPLLLLPIVIERISVQEGFRFVMDDAEVRVNTTLLQLLERDFDLKVPIGETLPEDERGVDVGAVLDVFRRTALAMPRWEVEETACLGFFSFTKYLMWLDLKNREELLQSSVLRHLVEAPGAALVQDSPEFARDELDDLDPEEVFCPKDADSSQLSAVMAGSLGRSFVLEGPPGTGKSQTITNLIAQSLANGKRVLFVAEKRAALEVVHQRLADVGLAPFCLELHSRKSGPKAVLEQLRTTLELSHRRAPSEWNTVAEELQAQRSELNAFVLMLHKRREHGWSVHQAMSCLLLLRDAALKPVPELLQRSPEDVAHAHKAMDALIVASGSLGVPDQAPWWGVQRGDWTPAMTRDMQPIARRLRDAAVGVEQALTPIFESIALKEVFSAAYPSAEQLATILDLMRALQATSPPPASWLRMSGWREFDTDLERAIAIGRRRDELWQQLDPRWRREMLDLDLGALAASYRLHAESFVLLRWWRLRRFKPVLAAVASSSLGPAVSVRDDLDTALRVRDEDRQLSSCTIAEQGAGAKWQGGLADWDSLDAALSQTRELRQLVVRIAPGSLQPSSGILDAIAVHLDAQADGASSLHEMFGKLLSAHEELVAARHSAQDFLDLSLEQTFGGLEVPGYLGQVEKRASAWLDNATSLRDQCAYRRAVIVAEEASLEVFVKAHAHGELLVHELRPAFERSLYEGWLDGVHATEPELATFRGQDHEAAITRFAELDEQSIALGAEVVIARLAAKLPQLRDTQVATSELGMLERELKKQRRHKPVRRLLAEIRGLWPRLSPCVLMSPLSVAQFLDRDAQRFDLVVFDEASQIPMWDAVGAIGRGESLIVVGDSKQLPPTRFFQRADSGDDSEEDEIPEDLESVLDECGAAGLPRMHLDWHYRSRHESLIAFSNHHYYQNRLLTFPSPQAVAKGVGVSCVRVDGVYDRAGSQQNRIEADALVKTVVARLRDPAMVRRSMGIVTFSRAQQTLIEDLLDAERRADPSLDAALMSVDEELFVKNLENVQGDERDVILFSICYGPDAAGKIYENYGPLNLQGGERRLNVAVTRARLELIVFSSVGPEQIANRTQAVGARHLRYYLDYALRGEAALIGAIERDPSLEVDSPFEASVRDALKARGHEIHTQVGCSGYRIDLAVVDPKAPGRYLVGIECDGATYHSAATARDRDRLRASVLRSLGWRLTRIWSTDYWHDPVGELDRIEAEIELARTALRDGSFFDVAARGSEAAVVGSDAVGSDAVGEEGHQSEPQDESDAEPRSEHVAPEVGDAPVDPDGPRLYAVASLLEQMDDRAMAGLLLSTESPIVFARFARTLGDAWGVHRVTDRLRERVRSALPQLSVEEEEVLWMDADQRSNFRGFRVPEHERDERSAEELPIPEVTNAMAWLLRQHHALAAEDLAREAARCFGIQRLGNVVRQVMDRALESLRSTGRCVADGSTVRLPN